MAPTIAHLIDRSTEIYLETAPLNQEEADSFVADFSLDFIFKYRRRPADSFQASHSVFQTESLGQGDLQTVVKALEKVLTVARLTPFRHDLLEHCAAAIDSKKDPLQRLGVTQLGRISMEAGDPDIESAAVAALIHGIEHVDLGVSVASSECLTQYFIQESKAPLLVEEKYKVGVMDLLKHKQSTVQIRALDWILRLALTSAAARRAIQSAGLVEQGMTMLMDVDDVLTCTTLWNQFAVLLTDPAVNNDTDAAAVMAAWLAPHMGTIVDNVMTYDKQVMRAIIAIIAPILSQTLSSDNQTERQFCRYSLFVQSIIQHCQGDDFTLNAAIESLGQLGRTMIGAETLFRMCRQVIEGVVDRATSTSAHPAIRIAARLCLATIAESSGDRLFSPEIEEALRVVYSPQGKDDGVWLINSLRNELKSGTLELKQSVYTLIKSLANRAWFTRLLCLDQGLRKHIIHSESEHHSEISQLRYACLQELTKTVKQLTLQVTERGSGSEDDINLPAVLEDLERGVRNGPLGRGVGAAVESFPIVGTEYR